MSHREGWGSQGCWGITNTFQIASGPVPAFVPRLGQTDRQSGPSAMHLAVGVALSCAEREGPLTQKQHCCSALPPQQPEVSPGPHRLQGPTTEFGTPGKNNSHQFPLKQT
ncbi:hypothetical protein AAFF_G00432850 [Aldrovandia affinis]|uniref:Uncharacterized protein n=1 Tax=Aldrovandia affinis TaxID=143900 RepID=A0AAD7S8V3_9TELE|nr:hypothetical protein AAFF_G00432850 [Aldrovandia affinis]